MDAMLLLKASLLLSATLLVARLLHSAPAVTRHRLWTFAFASVLALPVLAVALPALYVPLPACCAAPAAPGASLAPSVPSDESSAPGSGQRIVRKDSHVTPIA